MNRCATCRFWRLDPDYPAVAMRECAAIGHEMGYPNDSTGEAWEGRSGETGEDMTPIQLAEAEAIIRPGDPLELGASTLRTRATFGCTLWAAIP